MKKIYQIIAGAVAISFSQNAHAQEITQELDSFTFYSTLQDDSYKKTGRSITVIDSKAISLMPVQSLDELLKYLPQVEIQSRGMSGSQADISMRGSTYQQVMVLVDNMPINDALTGHFNTYIPVAIAEIERIEIIKGPSTAIYGPDAVGGVVNVITKTFAKSNQSSTSVTAGAGEYGFSQVQAGTYQSKEKMAYSVGFMQNRADGQLLANGRRTFFNNQTGSASMFIKTGTKSNIAFRTAYDSRGFNAQNYYTLSPADQASEYVTSWWNQAKFSTYTDKHTINIQGSYKYATDLYLYTPASVANQNLTNRIDFLGTDLYRINSRFKLLTGIQANQKTIISNDRGNHQILDAGVFATASMEVIENFTLNVTARGQYSQVFGINFLPQINGNYRLNNSNLRFTAAQTARNPDYTELYNNSLKTTVAAGQRVGNPDLKTEKALTYEVGFDHYFNNSFSLNVTAYGRNSKNLIDYVLTNSNDIDNLNNLIASTNYLYAKNIAATTTQGVELQVNKTGKITDKISYNSLIGYTYTDTKLTENKTSLYLLNHARHIANGNIGLSAYKFQLSVNAIYKFRNVQSAPAINSQITADYFLLNLKLAYELQPNIKIYTQINNLSNKAYADVLGANLATRWISGGLQISL